MQVHKAFFSKKNNFFSLNKKYIKFFLYFFGFYYKSDLFFIFFSITVINFFVYFYTFAPYSCIILGFLCKIAYYLC